MNGMHQESAWAWTLSSMPYSVSFQYELPPTPTVAQISLAKFAELDSNAYAELGFMGCTYLDQNSVPRTDTFPDLDFLDNVLVFARNGLTSASYQLRVSNSYAAAIVNFFFWDYVY